MLTPREQVNLLWGLGYKKPLSCAWVSHHSPTRHQLRDLNARGYCVFPALNRTQYVRNHIEAWEAAIAACGNRAPDLVVAVLPVNMLAALAHYAQPVPVWIADMNGSIWGGTWRALNAPFVELVTTPVERTA